MHSDDAAHTEERGQCERPDVDGQGERQDVDHSAALCSLALAAAQAGNCKALMQCLEAGAHADGACDESGNTPLLAAAAQGHAECVMALIRAGADLSITNSDGEGPLHICFARGHTSLGTAIAAAEASSSSGLEHDWAAYAEDHGIDTEAVIAAMELGLDLNIFEPLKAPVRGHGELGEVERDIDRGSGGSAKRPHIPTLQLLTSDITETGMSTSERELAQAALAAREAEAEMHEAADLGAQYVPGKRDKKKREKIRGRTRFRDNESKPALGKPAQHVSESIMLIGKTQAIYESSRAKMTQAQLEAAELDREIQLQLDEGLLTAAQTSDVKGIALWLEKGAMISAQDQTTGSSALHLAAAAGNKRACKAVLREGADLGMRNFAGKTAPDLAYLHGHEELGEYLRSKAECVEDQSRLDCALETTSARGGQLANTSWKKQGEPPPSDQHMIHEDVANGISLLPLGRTELALSGEDLQVHALESTSNVALKATRTMQGDVKGLIKQLRLIDMATYPLPTDSDAAWDSWRSSHESENPDQLSLDDDGPEYDDLTCAEELVRTVTAVTGKGAFTDLDLLLEEADRVIQDQDAEEELDDDDDNGEFDALAHLTRILEKNPVPARTTLLRISAGEDRAEIFRRRGLELEKIRQARREAAKPRILSGVALVIANMSEPHENGLSTHEQFTCDLIQLEKALPVLGFDYVDISRNRTRAQVIDQVFETCTALCPGGNLEHADGFLLLVLSTGGPTSFDCKPAPGANQVAQGACSVGFQEVINLVRMIPSVPKVTMFNICGDPEERKKANFDVPLRPMPCVPNLYQKMLNGCQDVLMVLNVTSGKVNWVPKAGSLALRFFLEEIGEEGINKDLADIIIGVRERLLEYFFSRRGTGKPQCPVGRREYENFFIQTPIFSEGTSDCKLMLGPAIKFAKTLCGADFLSQPGFFLQRVDTRVCKDKPTEEYVHAYGTCMPRTCEGLEINLDKGTPNLAWEFVLLEIDGSEEVYIGAAVPPTSVIQRAPSFSKVASTVSRVASAANAFKRIPSTASNGSSSSKIRRAPSIQRAGSVQSTGSTGIQRAPSGCSSGVGAVQGAPSFGRTRSTGSNSGSLLDLRTVAVVGKAPDSFSISADGRINPNLEGTKSFGGLKSGSVIQVWHSRSNKELEFTVDGQHIQKVWKHAALGQLLVPAVSIGPSTTCTLDITNFWSW